MMEGKIDAVIVNWNSGNGLGDCLTSISKYCPQIGRVVVVDNGSSDGSESICSVFSSVTLMRTGENLGFAKACNRGAKNLESEWLLFLNPDAKFLPDSQFPLEQLLGQVGANVGICGAQLLDERGNVTRTCARFPDPWMFFAHSIGLDRFWPKLGYPMREWDHGTTQMVDHVIGAFFLVRKRLFQELNGFDERFFLYMEDLDFSYRAKQHGWQSLYHADLKVFHEGGGTSKQVKAARLSYDMCSRVLYAKKYFSKRQAILQVAAILFLEPLSRFLGLLLRPSLNSTKELIKGYALFLRRLCHA